LKCPVCGKCACDLSPGERRVLRAFTLTYCGGCVYGNFPRKKKHKRIEFSSEAEFLEWIKNWFPELYEQYEAGYIDVEGLKAEITKRYGQVVVIG